MLKKILIANKQTASLYLPQPKTLLIRITDPGQHFISLKHKHLFLDILELRFFDNIPNTFDCNLENMFNIATLDKILIFLNRDDFNTILIHCDYGSSRSPGLGLALQKHLFNTAEVEIIHNYQNIKPLIFIEQIFEKHLLN